MLTVVLLGGDIWSDFYFPLLALLYFTNFKQ